MKTIKDILAKSNKATCGITEREVRVKRESLSQRIKTLEKGGFHVIGTSHGKTPMKTVWFIRRGGL